MESNGNKESIILNENTNQILSDVLEKNKIHPIINTKVIKKPKIPTKKTTPKNKTTLSHATKDNIIQDENSMDTHDDFPIIPKPITTYVPDDTPITDVIFETPVTKKKYIETRILKDDSPTDRKQKKNFDQDFNLQSTVNKSEIVKVEIPLKKKISKISNKNSITTSTLTTTSTLNSNNDMITDEFGYENMNDGDDYNNINNSNNSSSLRLFICNDHDNNDNIGNPVSYVLANDLKHASLLLSDLLKNNKLQKDNNNFTLNEIDLNTQKAHILSMRVIKYSDYKRHSVQQLKLKKNNKNHIFLCTGHFSTFPILGLSIIAAQDIQTGLTLLDNELIIKGAPPTTIIKYKSFEELDQNKAYAKTIYLGDTAGTY